MKTIVAIIALVALALASSGFASVVAPRVRQHLVMRDLRARAFSVPPPSYLTHSLVDRLIAAHRAMFGANVAGRTSAARGGFIDRLLTRNFAMFGNAVMMELWDILTPSDLTRRSRVLPIPNAILLDKFLPNRVVNSFRPRIRTVTRTLTAAKFRVWNAENFVAKRPVSVTLQELELPPVGQKLPLTEKEILEKALTGNDPNGDVIDQIYADADTNVTATHVRMELARGQLLYTGKVTINENGLVGVEADFGLTNAHKPTAAVLWSDVVNSIPLTNERAWIQQMIADGGGAPTDAITSQAVVDLLCRNAEYRTAFWGGITTSQPSLNPEQLAQVRRTYGLPPITVYDSAFDVDGTTTRAIPDNRFILINDAGETQWGLTAQALEVASGGSDAAFTRRDAPGLFTATYKQTEPAGRWTSTYAVALPLLTDKTRLLAATVK